MKSLPIRDEALDSLLALHHLVDLFVSINLGVGHIRRIRMEIGRWYDDTTN